MAGDPDLPPLEGNHSKLLRHVGDGAWSGIAAEAYKPAGEGWRGITRYELIGRRGESPRFHVRYFEIEPGGFTTLERHEHEHVVIVLRGQGEAQAGARVYRIAFGDVVYVAPDDPHQFRCAADAREPFGFLCIVNAERDHPRPVAGADSCTICE